MNITNSMEAINKIEAVSERDIDLLLLEEFNISDDFSLWFGNKVFSSTDNELKLLGAWHSITDPEYGESDLIIKYTNGLAVLIENKIDAIAQPEQGLRYRKRGNIGIENKLWNSFITCMIAPKLYLQKESDSVNYDSKVSYEEISTYFLNKSKFDKRSAYRAHIINEAIEQNRRGYTIIPNERVTIFWGKYWELSSSNYQILQMKKPGLKPTFADWPEFRLQQFNKKMKIVHKLEQGYVDLQISGSGNDIEKIQTLVNDSGLFVVKAGKSAAIRIETGKINKLETFESQKDKVINGLERV